MMTKEKVARINELAAKEKTAEGLTDREIEERNALRKEYVASVRKKVKEQLKRVRFIEDLSPEERALYERKNKS